MKKHNLILLLTLPFILSACVSLGKFEEMQTHRDALQISLDSLKNVVAELDVRIGQLRSDNASLHSQIADKNARNAELEAMADTLSDRVQALQNELDILKQNYDQSKSKNSAEIKKLLSNLEALQRDVAAREMKLKEYEDALALRDSSLAEMQKDLVVREQKVVDLQKRLAARDSALNRLKTRLNDALLGFTSSGLSITIDNGRVYVSLSNQLLFSTGRTDIDKRGKEALKELASVLNQQTDISILVEGHTDNQAVKNLGAIKDNWDLSVLRATEVIRFLTIEGKMDPQRITASGRSEYNPIDSASTPDALAKNRRTEIILIPRLSELFEILEN
jgi:chemotaxis protein MotB